MVKWWLRARTGRRVGGKCRLGAVGKRGWTRKREESGGRTNGRESERTRRRMKSEGLANGAVVEKKKREKKKKG